MASEESQSRVEHCPNCAHPLEETTDRAAAAVNFVSERFGYQFVSCWFCRHWGVETLV